MKNIIFAGIFAFLSCATVFAQDETEYEEEYTETEETTEVAEPAHHFNHHAGLFLGASSNLNHGEHAFTLGLDYEYAGFETHPKFTLGGLFEMGFAKEAEFIVGPHFNISPMENLFVRLAPLYLHTKVEKVEYDYNPYNPKVVHQEFADRFVLRIGGYYNFHFQRFSISPHLYSDISGSKFNLTYGVSFGIGF